jgi:cobaltochelatase CobS
MVDKIEVLRFGKATLKMQKLKDYKVCRHKKKCAKKDIKCAGKKGCEKYESIQPYIPELDDNYVLTANEKGILETLAFAFNNNENVLIVGPPGLGKTTIVQMLCGLTNWESLSYSCSEETRYSFIIGQWILAGNKMVWSDGVICDAFRTGKVVIENESDFMRPELRGAIHGILDQGGTIVLQAVHPDTGDPFMEVIERHPNFRLVSTANTTGLGEDSHLFHGTHMQNAASRDRYSVIIRMDYLPVEAETEVLVNKTGIDKETATKMSKVAWGIRDIVNSRKTGVEFQFTLRRLLSWAKYHQIKPAKEAIQLSLLNFIRDTPEERETLIRIIHTHFGQEAVNGL